MASQKTSLSPVRDFPKIAHRLQRWVISTFSPSPAWGAKEPVIYLEDGIIATGNEGQRPGLISAQGNAMGIGSPINQQH